MNLIKGTKTKQNSNIKEWGPNAKQKNKGENNINWFKGKNEKNQTFDKRNQTKISNQKKEDETWNQDKIRGKITFQSKMKSKRNLKFTK